MGITRILSSGPKESVTIDREKLEGLIDDVFREAKKFRFNSAAGSLALLLKELPGLKNSLRAISNTLTSLREGLNNDEVSKAEASRTVAETEKTFRAYFEEFVENMESSGAAHITLEDLNKDTLRSYDEDMNRVQTILNRQGTFAGYLSVIPIARPPFDVRKLKKVGIDAEAFASYVILKKQLVMGITNDTVNQMVSTGMKKPEVLEEYCDLFKQRFTSMRLSTVGTPVSWWNTTWIWFVPMKQMNLWRGATISETSVNSVNVQRWSMPFIR